MNARLTRVSKGICYGTMFRRSQFISEARSVQDTPRSIGSGAPSRASIVRCRPVLCSGPSLQIIKASKRPFLLCSAATLSTHHPATMLFTRSLAVAIVSLFALVVDARPVPGTQRFCLFSSSALVNGNYSPLQTRQAHWAMQSAVLWVL